DPKLQRDGLQAGQVGRQEASVVLVEQPELPRAEGGRCAPRQPPDLDAVDARRPGRELLEACQDAEQRALARAARPEDDHDLARRDGQRHALQRDRAAGLGLEDAERVVGLDGRRHARLQLARGVVTSTSATRTRRRRAAAARPIPQAGTSRSGGSGTASAAETCTSATASCDSTSPRPIPPAVPTSTSTSERIWNWRRSTTGATPWASRSNSSPRSSRRSLTSATR